MLNSFGQKAVNRQVASTHAFSFDSSGQGSEDASASVTLPPQQSMLTRLFVRRWLIALFASIIFMLAVFYRLPWHAEALSLVAFAIGAALIPRAGLSSTAYPAAQASSAQLLPSEVAATLIDALPGPTVLLSQDGTIFSFNDKAHEVFGGLRAGSHISSATRSPQVLHAIAKCTAGNPLQTVMFSDRVPVERHMAATVSFLDMPPKAPLPSMLLFMTDLTEQRRLDQLRADFIANASHEIKTPLASLLGFIETLQGAARHDEEARDRFLAIMAKQAERMARLIDNLMSLSRVEMRAHLKPRDPVMILELVSQACEALEPMASEANIQVTIHSELHGISVLGDRDELAQVFINLLHNAIKYGRPGGTVKVLAERRESSDIPMIAIMVEDNGPGIASQHLPRLTERFYRVPGSASLEKGGTGLGLAIVKHVVNRHRGELRISSEEGIGSSFTVLLAEYKQAAGVQPACAK